LTPAAPSKIEAPVWRTFGSVPVEGPTNFGLVWRSIADKRSRLESLPLCDKPVAAARRLYLEENSGFNIKCLDDI
jgi:hypothetical protein